MKDPNAVEYKVSSHSITIGMNHRDEVIAVFATAGPLTVDLMDELMTRAYSQCMENAAIVKEIVNKFTKTIL